MTSSVRIYRPSKTAMQSGLRNTQRWLLDFEPGDAQVADSLMGWAGSHDTTRQLRMWFDSKEEAIAFAKKKGFEYRVVDPQVRPQRPRAYADNFAFNRIR
ncbi:MAG: ETC complex I subunit [Rhodospirillaceae bacterium]|nr:ETC complex I subunit [Rhodospirillaceae bacterium]